MANLTQKPKLSLCGAFGKLVFVEGCQGLSLCGAFGKLVFVEGCQGLSLCGAFGKLVFVEGCQGLSLSLVSVILLLILNNSPESSI